MRHLNDHRKLNVTSKHRTAMLRNIVCALFEHGSIKTTLPKAKEARRVAEKLITIGKRAVASQDAAVKLRYLRQIRSELNNLPMAQKLIDEIAPKYVERKGGYTRVLKAGFRLGDRGAVAVFQLV